MRNKIILIAACLLVLGLGVAGFAYKTGVGTTRATACACCKGDSCPMKKQNASATDKASCCDDCDCCKGDSCPMHKKTDGAMKDSCPMHKTGPTEMKHDATADADKSCDCSCCKHHKEKKHTAAAVYPPRPTNKRPHRTVGPFLRRELVCDQLILIVTVTFVGTSS